MSLTWGFKRFYCEIIFLYCKNAFAVISFILFSPKEIGPRILYHEISFSFGTGILFYDSFWLRKRCLFKSAELWNTYQKSLLISINFVNDFFLIIWKDYESISILFFDLLNKISFSWSQFRLPLNCCCVAKSGGIWKCWHHNLSPKTKTVTILNWVIKGGSFWPWNKIKL